MSRQDASPVLVVEDDVDARLVLEKLLTARGYEVHLAQNGQEALDLLHSLKRPCLILLDLMMPVMDGWKFLGELKNTQEAAESTVIVVSAVADRMAPAGHPIVQKPADFERLLRLVDEYCPRSSGSGPNA
jgi:CheY-like chemotaxis protein